MQKNLFSVSDVMPQQMQNLSRCGVVGVCAKTSVGIISPCSEKGSRAVVLSLSQYLGKLSTQVIGADKQVYATFNMIISTILCAIEVTRTLIPSR